MDIHELKFLLETRSADIDLPESLVNSEGVRHNLDLLLIHWEQVAEVIQVADQD